MFKFYRSVLAAGVVALGLAACGDNVTVQPPPPPSGGGVTSVTVTPANITIGVGQTEQLALSVVADSGVVDDGQLDDRAMRLIATVSATGVGHRRRPRLDVDHRHLDCQSIPQLRGAGHRQQCGDLLDHAQHAEPGPGSELQRGRHGRTAGGSDCFADRVVLAHAVGCDGGERLHHDGRFLDMRHHGRVAG